jgi:formate--tetrahydrofolate ligase
MSSAAIRASRQARNRVPAHGSLGTASPRIYDGAMSTPALSPQPMMDLAREAGLDDAHIELYGRNKAKIDLRALERPAVGKGRLILVSAINPTPAGEGKTTTSIALGMGMRRIGKRVMLALREPSLGPVFGVKGGGTGGGRATLVPSDDINLHFTGDMHAITTAHNLLSAMIDNAAISASRSGKRACSTRAR